MATHTPKSNKKPQKQLTNLTIEAYPANSPGKYCATLDTHNDTREARVSRAYATLRRKSSRQNTAILKLKTKIEKRKIEDAAQKPSEGLADALKQFPKLLRKHGIQLSVKTVLHALLLKASSQKEVEAVLAKTKTLTRIKSAIKKKSDDARIAWYITRRTSLNRIFAGQQDICDSADYLSEVFGANIIKKASSRMIFYHYPIQPSLRDYTILMAHFDGKYTKCPSPFKQSVELRLMMVKGEHQITITFARALLMGFSTEDYVEFFETAKNQKLKKMTDIVTDFEIGLFSAVQQVFPTTRVRGCWFHYWNNLLSHAGLLSRATQKTYKKCVVNFLAILPFLHNMKHYVMLLIESLGHTDEQERYSDVDYKIIIYVLNTYMLRFGSVFAIDIDKCIIRTNNSCEGSNSAMAQHFARKPDLRDFTDFIEVGFKKQAVLKPQKSSPLTSVDRILLQVRQISFTGTRVLLDALLPRMNRDSYRIKRLSCAVTDLARKCASSEHMPIPDVHDALMRQLQHYKELRAERKELYHTLRRKMMHSRVEDIRAMFVPAKDNMQTNEKAVHREESTQAESGRGSYDSSSQEFIHYKNVSLLSAGLTRLTRRRMSLLRAHERAFMIPSKSGSFDCKSVCEELHFNSQK